MKLIGTLISVLAAVLVVSSCSLLGPSAPEIQRPAAYKISTQTGITQGQSVQGGQVVSWFDIPFAQPLWATCAGKRRGP